MDIIVNRFSVRHDGVQYKVGDVIGDLPDSVAAKLIKESNGDIVELAVRKPRKQRNDIEKIRTAPPTLEPTKDQEDPEDEDNEDLRMQLPDPNIDAAIKPGSRAKK